MSEGWTSRVRPGCALLILLQDHSSGELSLSVGHAQRTELSALRRQMAQQSAGDSHTVTRCRTMAFGELLDEETLP
jgi:hypothetical protein